MILGPALMRGFPAGPPVRDFDSEEENLKADIALNERFAKSIWRILPAFVTDSAIQRMGGIEGIANVLEEFHRTFRDWMCLGLEAELESLREERARPPQTWKPPKPTIEELASAQMNVQRLEDAIAAMDNLGEKESYAFGAYVAMMRPILEGNVDQARSYLNSMQARMDDVDDEATETSVSKGQAAGEEKHPDEAES
jgi:hypothetical protein